MSNRTKQIIQNLLTFCLINGVGQGLVFVVDGLASNIIGMNLVLFSGVYMQKKARRLDKRNQHC